MARKTVSSKAMDYADAAFAGAPDNQFESGADDTAEKTDEDRPQSDQDAEHGDDDQSGGILPAENKSGCQEVNVAGTAGAQTDDGHVEQLIPEINQYYVVFMRLLKAILVAVINTGATLRQAKTLLGDAFPQWVMTRLPLDVAEAECFIRFSMISGLKAESLSAAVDVKLPQLLDLLKQLVGLYGENAQTASHAESIDAGNVAVPMRDNSAADQQPPRQTTLDTPSSGRRKPKNSEHGGLGSRSLDRQDLQDPDLNGSQRAAVAVNLIETHEAALAAGDVDHVGPDLSSVNSLYLSTAKELKVNHPVLFEAVLAGKMSIPKARQKAGAHANLKLKYFQAGKVVLTACRKASVRKEKGEKTSGEQVTEQLGEALGINPRTLYMAANVADRLSREQFNELAQHPEITWSHVAVLVDVHKPEVRQQLQDRIVKERLPVRQLSSEIRELHKKKRRGPGRAKGVPASAGSALRLLQKGIKGIRKSLGDVWLGERYNLVDTIVSLPAKKLTPKLRDQAQEAIAEAEQFAKELPGHIKRLCEGLEWVNAGLNDPEEEPKE